MWRIWKCLFRHHWQKCNTPQLCIMHISHSSLVISLQVNASQTIAIKVFERSNDPLSPAESMEWEKYQQISREARVICRLIHDNILQLVGIAIAPFMLLLELAPLGDLKSCVEKFQQVNAKLNVRVLSSTLIQVRTYGRYQQ